MARYEQICPCAAALRIGVPERLRAGDWYVGYAAELPGANTQGETLEEARENLREAIELILLSNRELAEKELAGKEVIREHITVSLE